MTYQQYKKELLSLMKLKDREGPHERLDDLICDIAIDASFGELSSGEVRDLVALYKKNAKWYA